MIKIITSAMQRVEDRLGAKWEFMGDGTGLIHGYINMPGIGHYRVEYIALPVWHPLVGVHYYDLPDGGAEGILTYVDQNVFGWDYCLQPEVNVQFNLCCVLGYFAQAKFRTPLWRRWLCVALKWFTA